MSLPNGAADAVFLTALSLAAGYVVASAAWLLRRPTSTWRSSAFIGLSALLFVCPFLVPRGYGIARCFVSAVMVLWWMKSWDAFHRSAAADTRFPHYLVSLLNLGDNVGVPPDSKPWVPPFTIRWREAVCWGGLFCFAVALIDVVFTASWKGWPFMFEHLAKVASVVFGLVFCGWNFHSAMWRLGGRRALRFPLKLLWSATPADFWRSWNPPVREWLVQYVFKPTSRTGHMRMAVLTTFLVSGVMHEYIVSMASGRVSGYPTAFFLLQGCGVLGTVRLKPQGRWRVLGAVSTSAFNAVSSVLLFAPLATVLPFYVNKVPHWVHLW